MWEESTLFRAGSQEGFPDVDTMPISAQMPSDVGNPNSFLSSSLSTINIYLAPFSVSCMWCVRTCLCMFHVCSSTWGCYLGINLSLSLLPLYTNARSLSQIQSSPTCLVLLISLLWGIPSLTPQAGITGKDIMTTGFPHTWFTHWSICPVPKSL